ncbi:MAG: hypothetical protein OEY95_01620 [Candidatus Bathyarchaeota archaeon]|nr:hypothetical protein [Candidatus Bathyarchaeota archaeon]
MIDVGDYVVCPVCGGKARVVYVSRDGKRCIVKCLQRHIHGLRSIRGLCFLVDCSEVKRNERYLSKPTKLM